MFNQTSVQYWWRMRSVRAPHRIRLNVVPSSLCGASREIFLGRRRRVLESPTKTIQRRCKRVWWVTYVSFNIFSLTERVCRSSHRFSESAGTIDGCDDGSETRPNGGDTIAFCTCRAMPSRLIQEKWSGISRVYRLMKVLLNLIPWRTQPQPSTLQVGTKPTLAMLDGVRILPRGTLKGCLWSTQTTQLGIFYLQYNYP